MYNLLLSLETARLRQYVTDYAEKPNWRKIEELVESVRRASMDVIFSVAMKLPPTKTELLEAQTLQKECAQIIDTLVAGTSLENIEHASVISLYAQRIRKRAQVIGDMIQIVQQREKESIPEPENPTRLQKFLRAVTGAA